MNEFSKPCFYQLPALSSQVVPVSLEKKGEDFFRGAGTFFQLIELRILHPLDIFMTNSDLFCISSHKIELLKNINFLLTAFQA